MRAHILSSSSILEHDLLRHVIVLSPATVDGALEDASVWTSTNSFDSLYACLRSLRRAARDGLSFPRLINLSLSFIICSLFIMTIDVVKVFVVLSALRGGYIAFIFLLNK
eukprot:sb/3477303/